jgi:hypothetical protein
VDNVLRWNSSGSRVLPAQVAPRWRAVRQGLGLAALGYVLLLVALLGVVLAGLAPRAERLGRLPAGLEEEDSELFGLLLAGAAGLLGYLLLVVGQWRCLGHAPQGDGAKDWMFASFLCLLVVPVPFAVAHFAGGAANYAILQQGLGEVDGRALLEGAGLLQLAGASLILLSCLLFGQFQRAARRSLAGGAPGRLADGYFFFVFLLLGACAGPAFTSRATSRQVVLEALAVGWGLSWLWQLAVILGTRRAIRATLRRPGLGTGEHRRPRFEPREPALNGTGWAGP